MMDVERALTTLGRDLDAPEPGEAFVAGVTGRLRPIPLRSRRLRPVRIVAIAAAAVLLLGGAAVAVRFAIRGVEIERVPVVPSVAPGEGLPLGTRTTLAEAQDRVPYRVRSLAALGAPDAVYVDPSAPGLPVTMVYEARADIPRDRRTGIGLLFTQLRAEADEEAFTKLVGPRTRVEQVTVGRAQGIWIEGEAHAVFYRDRDGLVFDDPLHLAGNVLLWQVSDVTYRIEADLSRAEAIRLARSLD